MTRAHPGGRLRPALAAGLLGVLAVCEARTLKVPELARRARLAAAEVSGVEPARGSGTGFYFDPAYSDFLAEVARRTPSDATVAVLVPRQPDIYRYQAVYTLAPRRVVDEERAAEARWIAAWRSERGRAASGVPIGDGFLLAR